MAYEHGKPATQPSLSEMTAKAISILSQNPRGYLLVVEGGNIDRALQTTTMYNALEETLALDKAVSETRASVQANKTLLVVTADHSSGTYFAGASLRNNGILDVCKDQEGQDIIAEDGSPYTALGFAHGLTGMQRLDGWPDDDTTAPEYKQEAVALVESRATRGFQDVGVWATGPRSHYIGGVFEQN